MADPYAAFSSPVAKDPYAAFASPVDAAPAKTKRQIIDERVGKRGRPGRPLNDTDIFDEIGAAVSGAVKKVGADVAEGRQVAQRRLRQTNTQNMLDFARDPLGFQDLARTARTVGDVIAVPFAPVAVVQNKLYTQPVASVLERLPGYDRATAEADANRALMGARPAPSGPRPVTVAEQALAAAKGAPAALRRGANALADAPFGTTKTANALRPEVAAQIEAQRAAAEAEALAARRGSVKQLRVAQRNRTQAQAAAAEATPAPFAGEVKPLSERGAPVQEAIIKKRDALLAQRAAEREALAAPVTETIATKEAGGNYISDTPEAKKLLTESRRAVSPSPTKSPTATSLPTPEEARVHNRVIDALRNRRVEVPESYVNSPDSAGAQIVTVNSEEGPRYYRVFKTQYDAVDNLRRRFGDAFHKIDVTGFEGVPQALVKKLYHELRDVQRAYVGPELYDPMQASYSKFTKLLEPYRDTTLGKAISGTQRLTGVENLTASQVPGAVIAKGAGGAEQVAALGGNPRQLLADTLAAKLYDPTTGGPLPFAKAAKLLHDTPLGDAVAADPALSQAVGAHMAQLQRAEQAGTRAAEFTAAAEEASKTAGKLTETAAAAAQAKRAFNAELLRIKGMSPAELAKSEALITKTLTDAYARGAISEARYTELLGAYTKLGKQQTRKNALLKLGGAAGAGIIGLNYAKNQLASQSRGYSER